MHRQIVIPRAAIAEGRKLREDEIVPQTTKAGGGAAECEHIAARAAIDRAVAARHEDPVIAFAAKGHGGVA